MTENLPSFGDMTERSKIKRAANRFSSARILVDNEIPFTPHNNGAHLIVEPLPGEVFDFWPGTGKFKKRDRVKYGRGVFNLLAEIRALQREVGQ